MGMGLLLGEWNDFEALSPPIGTTMANTLPSPREAPRRGGRERNLVLVGLPESEEPHPSAGIRVLVAHGDRLARAGFTALLQAEPDVVVVGSAGEGAEAIALAEELRPDVLLLDMAVPGMDALSVTRLFATDAAASSTRVLILGESDEDERIFSSLRAGASGFLVKDAEPSELMQGIRRVAAGEAALSPSSVRRVIDELAGQPDPLEARPELLDELTARELEVMALVAGGLSNGEIAQRLVVTLATAKTHVSRVMTKLRAHHRAQLVTLAYETGLVRPSRVEISSSYPLAGTAT
jgi:DNA-binding NarL/FixJ family response regulator